METFEERHAHREGCLPNPEWLDPAYIREQMSKHDMRLNCNRCLRDLFLLNGVFECPKHGREYCMSTK